MIAYLISGDGNITLVLKGTQFYINKSDEKYDAVIEAIKADKTEDEILDIVNVSKQVADYLFDTDIKVKDGVIMFQDEEVHNTLTERIIAFMKEGLPTKPLFNFLKKLMGNPSFSARKELFDFLNHKSLPITEDGDFLAYKAVNNNFTDKYSGKFDNSVGNVVEIPRHKVDDDRSHGCSAGLHAGTLDYVQGYGRFTENAETTDKCIIVKINPSDVVSVPSDCSCQKLRTCRYDVIKEYEGELKRNLYTDDGREWCDDDTCDDCGCHVDDCTCEDFCQECQLPFDDCTC